MPEFEPTSCDHSDDIVEIFSDRIDDVASAIDWGVLVEYSQDGIAIYFQGVEESCAERLLQRALDYLRGS